MGVPRPGGTRACPPTNAFSLFGRGSASARSRRPSARLGPFGTKDTGSIWHGFVVRGFSREVQIAARRKLRMLNSATQLADLPIPPGNCLEALKGDRKGQHSIRVNEQIRICSVWKEGDCHEVEILDYHE